jgi:hypothetical protein
MFNIQQIYIAPTECIYTAENDLFLQPRQRVLTAWYKLNTEIFFILIFFLKGLKYIVFI